MKATLADDFLPRRIFPPPEEAPEDETGVLGFSREITCEMLAEAYYHGIFPWPEEDEYIPWCSPGERGVIPLEEFHIGKNCRRLLRQEPFELRVDTAFQAVLEGCAAAARPGQDGTWIVPKMLKSYLQFHAQGWAHSFECWERQSGELVGGLYGVSVGGVFCGESMFFRVSGASKFALVAAALTLKKCGVKLIDCQMVTPTTQAFGARVIPRKEYLEALRRLRGAPLTTGKLQENIPTPTQIARWNPQSPDPLTDI